ncbi:MAG TPA: ABC transporter permease [Candidatus Sulfopaludibacter sp.]|jgi:putative ABC transport system permease protein|nr:ABC transporter permease [Candidatus Sulfopaludibacter sp.]
MSGLFQDLRYGLRVLGRNPGFATVAVLTLALGIGANTAIFSLVDAVLLRPLPYPNPDQLVGLGQWRNQKGQGYIQTGVSAPNIVDIAKSGAFQYVAYYRGAGFNLTEGDRPESVNGIKASENMLPMFGVPPMMGRFFSAEETETGHDQVAVIGHRLWQVRYGSDPAILGKTIQLDQKAYTIVGVMPASFRFTWDQEMDVFVPLALTPDERSEAGRGTSRDLETQARLRPGLSIPQAQAAMDTLAASLAREHPAADEGWGIKVEPLHAAYHRNLQTPLLIMLGAVMFVLLIACVNVANLLLARATARKREVAIRTAMGATRGRLTQQLLTESLLLASCGGVLGLLLAYAGDRLLTVSMASFDFRLPNAQIIDVDWRVMVFGLAITLATGAIFGLAPAWSRSHTGLSESLKEGGLRATADAGRRRLRNGLVVCEMALALVLLTGAGLLVRTFIELANVDLGIDPTNVITMGLQLPVYKYSSPTQRAGFFRDAMQKIESTAGVKFAGAKGGGGNVFFQPQGQPPAAPGQEPTASLKIVTPDFLQAMGTPLVSGRQFTDADNEGALPVALISETVAHRYWPHSDPLGSHITLLARVYSGTNAGAPRPLEIVGTAKDVRNQDLWRPEAAVYVPFAQNPTAGAMVAVRTAVPPTSVVSGIRDAVLSLDKEQPVNRIRTMSQIVSETYGAIRFPMALLWTFSALALVLSAVGIFGVMSYTVSRRTQEIAIRMALGASRREVLGLVFREGLGVTALGIVLGLAGGLLVSRVMAGYVYGITSTDPLTFTAAAALLAVVALLASYIPAARAARVDPMTALRCE